MEKKARQDGLLVRTARIFALPEDVVAGLPRVEVVGSREVRVENHKGILAYGDREICISGGKLLIRVEGESLALRAMTAQALYITGQIARIAWE